MGSLVFEIEVEKLVSVSAARDKLVFEFERGNLVVVVFEDTMDNQAAEVFEVSALKKDRLAAEVLDSIDHHYLRREFRYLVRNTQRDHCHLEKHKRFLFSAQILFLLHTQT